MDKNYIAHFRKLDGQKQSVEEHLQAVGEITSKLAEKLGITKAGKLLGLLHDLGKFSIEFQNYIKSGTGIINPDEDEYVESSVLKGKIDHSTAGAQWLWEMCKKFGKQGEFVGQLLVLPLVSHHSGLIDVINNDGDNTFVKRIYKNEDKTHLNEILGILPDSLKSQIESLADTELIESVIEQIIPLTRPEQHGQPISDTIKYFYIGIWTRMLFSCLIDADRIDSADFEYPTNKNLRSSRSVNWDEGITRLEDWVSMLHVKYAIDKIRQDISNTCMKRATDKQGIYNLTVPTGGGKTLASLRFALHHARKHGLDRIIYIIPYTSIIEQNANSIRKVIEHETDGNPWILEHHSNLEPEKQTWQSKLTAENWDAPIILLTMVQFLEVLFSGGTRGARKMHQIARSVLIFDEIQTLPIKMVHLFCNAINFLTTYTRTTVVLCTATQPLLDNLRRPDKGELSIPVENKIISNEGELFKNLKRVNIINKVKSGGWGLAEITELAISELQQKGSCLVVVNTKQWAQDLYTSALPNVDKDTLFHLSTSLCPAHRKKNLKLIKERLDNGLPVLCISTQLIEAGVDIDFSSVIRFLAGLDSIAQAAGRCNRNGKQSISEVIVLNPDKESIEMLTDIKIGRDKAERIFSEFKDQDFLSPEIMTTYFNYYFYERSDEMTYPVTAKQHSKNDTLLNLLSMNNLNPGYKKNNHLIQQSFMEAGKLFKSIDAPTQAVIVPYKEGKNIISELCAVSKEFDNKKYYKLIRQAQQYSVNVFPNIWKKLNDVHAIYEIQPGAGIYHLDARHYHENFGVSINEGSSMETLIQ